MIPRQLLALLLVPSLAKAAETPHVNYDREVRPILSENCFHCHGQDATKRKAKLRLDTREGQRSKEAVIPGQPDESELIYRIFIKEGDEQMPPPDSHRALTEAQKDLLKRWVAEGAEFSGHWAFQPLQRPAVPEVLAGHPANPIDRLRAREVAGGTAYAIADGHARDAHPARHARSHGSAADACRRGCFPRGREAGTPMSAWSIGCWPRHITASGWRCRGSTPHVTRTRTASSRTATPSNGSGATGW